MLKNSIDYDMHIYASKYIRLWIMIAIDYCDYDMHIYASNRLWYAHKLRKKKVRKMEMKKIFIFIINPLDVNTMA